MKFFVTDGQLAAMRLEIATEYARNVKEQVQMIERQHSLERADHITMYEEQIGRLREDHAALVTLLTTAHAGEIERAKDPHGPYVAHLEQDVVFWKLQFARERQRAEISIDQRLQETAKGIVTLPLREEPATDPVTGAPAPPRNDLLDELIKNVEFAAIGSAEGVPE